MTPPVAHVNPAFFPAAYRRSSMFTLQPKRLTP